jgi:long-subunit acyl-CoA synthetase (AMP-forming)
MVATGRLLASQSDRKPIIRPEKCGWGMTETTAVSIPGTLEGKHADWMPAERHERVAKQGKSLLGVELKGVDEKGATLPRDGASQGELMVRLHWTASQYCKADTSPLVAGWFLTGDIATIDAEEVMQIVSPSAGCPTT